MTETQPLNDDSLDALPSRAPLPSLEQIFVEQAFHTRQASNAPANLCCTVEVLIPESGTFPEITSIWYWHVHCSIGCIVSLRGNQ